MDITTLLHRSRCIAAGWCLPASLLAQQAYSPGPEDGGGSPSPGPSFPQGLGRSHQRRSESNHLWRALLQRSHARLSSSAVHTPRESRASTTPVRSPRRFRALACCQAACACANSAVARSQRSYVHVGSARLTRPNASPCQPLRVSCVRTYRTIAASREISGGHKMPLLPAHQCGKEPTRISASRHPRMLGKGEEGQPLARTVSDEPLCLRLREEGKEPCGVLQIVRDDVTQCWGCGGGLLAVFLDRCLNTTRRFAGDTGCRLA